MIAVWMIYALVLSGLVALAARGIEGSLRLNGRAGRWAAVVGLAASLALPGIALVQLSLPDRSVVPAGGVAAPAAVVAPDFFTATLGWLRLTPTPALERATPYVIALWALLSIAAFGLFALGCIRVAMQRRGWPAKQITGTSVLVSATFGPAVVGALHPEIVLPMWSLHLDLEGLDLVLRHELEHLRARDTLLLSAAYLASCAMPWNPWMWWQLKRLRLAVELDCDRRVLKSGASRKRYGALLLLVGERGGQAPFAAAALSEPVSFLERRIGLISQKPPRGRAPKTALSLATVAVLSTVAFHIPLPAKALTPSSESGDPSALPGAGPVTPGSGSGELGLSAIDTTAVLSGRGSGAGPEPAGAAQSGARVGGARRGGAGTGAARGGGGGGGAGRGAGDGAGGAPQPGGAARGGGAARSGGAGVTPGAGPRGGGAAPSSDSAGAAGSAQPAPGGSGAGSTPPPADGTSSTTSAPNAGEASATVTGAGATGTTAPGAGGAGAQPPASAPNPDPGAAPRGGGAGARGAGNRGGGARGGGGALPNTGRGGGAGPGTPGVGRGGAPGVVPIPAPGGSLPVPDTLNAARMSESFTRSLGR